MPDDTAPRASLPLPPVSLNPAPRLTIPQGNLYDTRDISDANSPHPHLAAALKAQVQSLAVEFLERGGARPHVVLLLKLAQPSALGTTLVRLSMEHVHDPQNPGSAACTVVLCDQYAPSLRSNAGYIFPLRNPPQQTLLDFIQAIKGRHLGAHRLGQSSDLTAFKFVFFNDASGRRVRAGTRDWVAQVFHRLYMMNWVDHKLGGILPPCQPAAEVLASSLPTGAHVPRRGTRPIDWSDAYFHEIIGIYPEKQITVVQEGHEHGPYKTSAYYQHLPLKRALFFDPEFSRVLSFPAGEIDAVLPYE